MPDSSSSHESDGIGSTRVSIQSENLFHVNPLQYLSDAELKLEVKNLETTLKHIKVENRVYRNFLEKNDPEAYEELVALFYSKQSFYSAKQVGSSSKSLPRRRSLSVSFLPRASSTPKEKETNKINYTQKMDLVQRELEEKEAELKATKIKTDRIRLNIASRIEEIEIRHQELEASLKDFQSFKEQTEIMTVDKFVRFMDEWSRKSRLTADKLRLRFSSLRIQYKKLSMVLAHKQLIGENLQEIDFEQLRIENVHLAQKVDQKNILLLELKKMTGEGNLKLSQHKTFMQTKLQEKNNILKAIKSVEKNIQRADDEIVGHYNEVDDVKENYNNVKERVRKYRAPDVMEYLTKKLQVQNLRKELKIWTRRKSIKDLALNIEIGRMKKLVVCTKTHPSWFE